MNACHPFVCLGEVGSEVCSIEGAMFYCRLVWFSSEVSIVDKAAGGYRSRILHWKTDTLCAHNVWTHVCNPRDESIREGSITFMRSLSAFPALQNIFCIAFVSICLILGTFICLLCLVYVPLLCASPWEGVRVRVGTKHGR